VHFHIIPKYDEADRASKGEGLGVRWGAGKLDADKGKALAKKIADAV
jgi:diadenosine tetraphosphate (Ap4A) HIT family hydrolase